jgi:Ca-activated chloride channel family protein
MSPRTQAQAMQYGFRPGVALDIDQQIYDKVWNEENGTKPFDTVHRFLAAPGGKVVKAARDAFRSIKNNALVYLVIDRSGSMNERLLDPELGKQRSRWEMAVDSADLLAARMQDKDRLTLVFYDYGVDYAPLTPPGQPIAMTAEGKQKLRKALARERPNGGTAMRNAIASAWDDLCEAKKKDPQDRSIRLIVVLTDGKDNGSNISVERLVKQIGYAEPDRKGGYRGDPQCKIPVFGIAFGEGSDATGLTRITEAAGGETRQGNSAEIRAIFRRFSELL